MELVGLDPFKLNGAIQFTPLKTLNSGLEYTLESILGLRKLNTLYRDLVRKGNRRKDFIRAVLDLFAIRFHVDDRELARVPRSGPVLLIANHPFGAIEGLIILAALQSVRDDVKVLGNYLLKRIPELDDLVISVNPFGGRQATYENIRPIKDALSWLKQGGLLVVFPAGAVSALNWTSNEVIDSAWNPNIARLLRLSGAQVLPVFFHGRNSWVFQILGSIHAGLRTALIPREFLNKKSKLVHMRIGRGIKYKDAIETSSDKQLIDYLRMHTYLLKAQDKSCRIPKRTPVRRIDETIGVPIRPSLLNAEVEGLDPGNLLLSSGKMRVYYASAQQIPWTLQEIGRLRETTFRKVGEGSGQSRDIDAFDDYYDHVFLWNAETREVVGSYRIGKTDEIVARIGLNGLYTHTLFKYSNSLISGLGNSLELGRSFVRQEYQRKFSSLYSLWKGIFCYIALHPQYHTLFGPVSISNDYRILSRIMLVEYLKKNNYDVGLSRHIKARTPFRYDKKLNNVCIEASKSSSMERLSNLLQSIEPDEKGVPVLIRHYTSLGGKMIGFNVDHDFNTLDGLIVVDLLKSEPTISARYFDRQAFQEFYSYHSLRTKATNRKYFVL